MSTPAHFLLFPVLVAALLAGGCDAKQKQTYHSSRRILALDVLPPTPPPHITKYLRDPSDYDGLIYEGSLGDFRGFITVAIVSSSDSEWRVQLLFDGKSTSGSAIHVTNLMVVPYPQSRRFDLPGTASVAGWFLSDEELATFDKDMSR